MKINSTLLLVLAINLASCGGNENKADDGTKGTAENPGKNATTSAEKPKNALFGIKSAKIVYDYKNFIETGTDIFWFDDYGNIAVLESERDGKVGHQKITTIWKDNKSTIINHTNKNVGRSGFRPKDTEPPSIGKVPEGDLKGIGYEKLPEEEIAGKKCMVIKNSKINVEYWIWNNIELKGDNRSSGEKYALQRTAKSVEENITIPADLFEIPDGYKGK